MKSITRLLIALVVPSLAIGAQDVTGEWNGVLEVQGTRMRLVFHVASSDSALSTTLDSPDQGATGIPVGTTRFSPTDSTLRFELPNIGAMYAGKLAGDSVSGTWTQGLNTWPLLLTRNAAAPRARNRPQEPVRPYPYVEEEVRITNKRAAVTLAGTLTLPQGEGPFPAVVLISGSGPQNRDEEVFGHKTFLVLADHLTRQGIAVVRYDDRGIGKSTGTFSTATSRDFASDAAAAVGYLATRAEIDGARIGVIGHSEGAMIAPMVAAEADDVTFVVMLAGIGMPGREISLMQTKTLRPFPVPDEEAFARFSERSIEIATSNEGLAAKRRDLTEHYEEIGPIIRSMLPSGTDLHAYIARQVANLTSPWQQYFLSYDPAPDLARLRVPALVLHGSRDVQVPAAPNQAGIRRALERGGHRNHTIKTLPGLNHMFQESESGAMNQYPLIEQTFSPTAMAEVSAWILRTTAR